jgi:hypothetical protein
MKEKIAEANKIHKKNMERKWKAIDYCEALIKEPLYEDKWHRTKKITELIKILLEIR